MSIHPTAVSRRGDDHLRIAWSDGTTREYGVRELREACPCATCREKHGAPPLPSGGLPILKPEEARPLALLGMAPMGNYAYGLQFSDGHDTGIYTLEHLRRLGTAVE